MSYQHLVESCFAPALGGQGLEEAAFNAILEETRPVLGKLQEWYTAGRSQLFALPERRDDLPGIHELADKCRRFDDLVVLGTGGSSLAGQALVALASKRVLARPGTPRLHFVDNIDPVSFESLLNSLNLRRTGFIAISKSGRTPETLTQFIVSLDVLRTEVGQDGLKNHFIAITEPGGNPLRRLAMRQGILVHDHDPDLGGRYSAFSVVGLLPAITVGFDAVAFREGGASVLKETLSAASPSDSAPAVGAAINVGLARHCGVTATVLMPYAQALAPFSFWFRQLWAESLGKDGKGTTPIAALGTVDQHSQLQLYLDGPKDKFFTLIHFDTVGRGRLIPTELADDEELSWLAGRRMGDLMEAEQRATADVLVRKGLATRVFRFKTLDEYAMGSLMMHFLLETIIAGQLLGVDPFTQPAVEECKRVAQLYMERMPPEQ